MSEIRCANCKSPYPESEIPYKCLSCGGLYDFVSFPAYNPDMVDSSRVGIWRYAHALGFVSLDHEISLGEGNTPLIWDRFFNQNVAFKCEYANPTGSFKDRGSAAIVSFLGSRNINEAVEDSSGNAGASFAAYAARAGIRARVYIPDSASGPKRSQIEAYGADVIRIMGPRSNASEAVRVAADKGVIYASHAYLPFNLPGYATAAYEIYEQLHRQSPGSVIVPLGQGGLLLGMLRGFHSLFSRGIIAKMPRFVGVQARACAPIWALHAYGRDGLRLVTEAQTVAEGIRVRNPLRGDAILHWVEAHNGLFLAVDEEDILPARDLLARRGFYVEATSAVVLKALEQVADQLPGPIIMMLTGSGLKSP